jgi:hypothetical protein
MSKKRLFTLCTALSLSIGCSACNSSREAGNRSVSARPKKGASGKPAHFEIRDFKIVSERSESLKEFRGRGTILTKEEGVQSSNGLVILKQKEVRGSGDPSITYREIYLEKGLGSITSWNYTFDDKDSPPEYKWNVVGWATLEPGKLASKAGK